MDELTRPIRAALSGRGDAGDAWCLTVAFHPDHRRIGQQCRLALGPDALHLGRDAPHFSDPWATSKESALGLGDTRVSRQALQLSPVADGWILRKGRSALRCAGHDVQHEQHLTREQLRQGVVLLLAHCVVLHLRLTRSLETSVRVASRAGDMLGVSDSMRRLFRDIRRSAQSPADVFIIGSTGTGKDLAARAIHAASDRRDGPWVAVNMSALTPELAAASLFGARRGAYTGADSDRRGFFQRAAGGTLFLDEIGDAPATVQPLLLRALQERELQVVGGGVERVELRVIAATEIDPDLPGSDFRRALRFRLGAQELRMPELGDRREDIGLLAVSTLRKAAAERQWNWCDTLDQESTLTVWARFFERCLLRDWPGNVRELQHRMRRIVAAADPEDARNGELISLLARFAQPSQHSPAEAGVSETPAQRPRLRSLSDAEFQACWAENGFEVARMARALGVSRQAVYRRLQRLDDCRLASDVPLPELMEALQACRGDLDATARNLAVSAAALRFRMRASGLEPVHNRADS